MKKLLTMLIIALNTCGYAADNPSGFAADASWHDGRVEKLVYAAERMIYGEKRTYDQIVLTNKQQMNRRLMVKAERGLDGSEMVEAFKMNVVETLETEYYPYHFLTMVFLHSETMDVLKMTVGSQEWCGMTSKTFLNYDGKPRLMSNSYFPGEGFRTFNLNQDRQFQTFESLPLYLRSILFEQGSSFSLNVLNPQVSNHEVTPELREARFAVEGSDEVESGVGTIDCFRVRMDYRDGKTLFWYEKDFPYAMVRRLNPDGTTLFLKERGRVTYWSVR